jgi:hypothetical protein
MSLINIVTLETNRVDRRGAQNFHTEGGKPAEDLENLLMAVV